MRMRSATLVVAGLALMALVTGCGDSGGDAADTPYRDANRICREVADRFDELQAQAPRSFEQGAELLQALAAASAEGEQAMGDVVAPPLNAAAFERYLRSRAKVGSLLDRGLQAARDEDARAYERVRAASNAASDERSKLAMKAGLPGCAHAEEG
jgi:hypothetical protein